mmetsp:Transcript_4427/g.20102  ORF Transcript_4427/g.20102 Transcript_4427/m.20102 type:complete len:275 (-) Transcript_4427:45-869(-)
MGAWGGAGAGAPGLPPHFSAACTNGIKVPKKYFSRSMSTRILSRWNRRCPGRVTSSIPFAASARRVRSSPCTCTGSYLSLAKTVVALTSAAAAATAGACAPDMNLTPPPPYLRRMSRSMDASEWCSHTRDAPPGAHDALESSPSSSGDQTKRQRTWPPRLFAARTAARNAWLSSSLRSCRNQTTAPWGRASSELASASVASMGVEEVCAAASSSAAATAALTKRRRDGCIGIPRRSDHVARCVLAMLPRSLMTRCGARAIIAACSLAHAIARSV